MFRGGVGILGFTCSKLYFTLKSQHTHTRGMVVARGCKENVQRIHSDVRVVWLCVYGKKVVIAVEKVAEVVVFCCLLMSVEQLWWRIVEIKR